MRIPFTKKHIRFVSAASDAQAAAARALGIIHGSPEEISPYAERDGQIAYGQNPFFYRAVETISDILSNVELVFHQPGNPEQVIKPEAPSGATGGNLPYVFSKRPNDYNGGDKLMGDFWRTYLIAGVAGIHFVPRTTGDTVVNGRPVSKSIMEAHSLPASVLSITIGNDGQPSEYIVGWTADNKVKFPINKGQCEIFVMTKHSPDKPFKGLAPARVGHIPLSAVNEANRHNWSQAKSGMAARGILTPVPKEDGSSTSMSQDDLEKFQQRLQESGGGSRNSGKILYADFAMQFLQTGILPKDMAFKEMTDYLARQILLVTGVPPQLIGVSTEANAYANFQQAQRAFFENVVIPQLNEFCSDLNAYFLRNGIVMEVTPDYEGVSVYRDIKLERMKAMKEIDFMTIDEKRDYFGLKPADAAQLEELNPVPKEDGSGADDAVKPPKAKPKSDKK